METNKQTKQNKKFLQSLQKAKFLEKIIETQRGSGKGDELEIP